MTKQNAKLVEQAGREADVVVTLHKTGTQRMNCTIAGKTYGGYNRALEAIGTEILRNKGK